MADVMRIARRRTGRGIKYPVALLLLSPALLPGADLQQHIRQIAAETAGCSRDYPCLVEVRQQDGGYAVHVRRSAGIDRHGILQFTTSSTWLRFDLAGKLLGIAPTP
jgi:hypothetical protein